MVRRYVFDGANGFLNARAAVVYWTDEQHGRGADRKRLPLQLRWMVNPAIGLPSQPFMAWRLQNPPATQNKHELANLPNWEPLEVVGLPVHEAWGDTAYSLKEQGPVNAPLPPIKAAIRRLVQGAPPVGWPSHDMNGLALPPWQEPNLEAYLDQLLRGQLLEGLLAMLRAVPADQHLAFAMKEGDVARLVPKLLLGNIVAQAGGGAGSGRWHPLRLLAMNAGTDPLAALALGFGTALDMPVQADDLYMVSVRHRIRPDLPDIELADVVRPTRMNDPVPAPTGLTTARKGMTRPQSIDAPALETVAVRWDRPAALPPAALSDEQPEAVSYCIGRYGPEKVGRSILLTQRPAEVSGWMAYTPGAMDDSVPVEFLDHVPRASRLANPPRTIVAPLGFNVTYVIAAQDLFGRWSKFSEVAYSAPRDEPVGPSIVSVSLTDAGNLTVDVSWDWTDRSPEFCEFVASFTDAPGVEVASVRLQFGGSEQAEVVGGAVTPLNQDRVACNWGADQDKQRGGAPEVRFYRWTGAVPLGFGVEQRWREIAVRGRGQARVHQTYIAGTFISDFGPARTTRVWNPTPPAPPAIESPRWASLPDALGIARFVLSWPTVPAAEGYAVYEATETSLLGAFGRPAPDLEASWNARIDALRGLDFAGAPEQVRGAFRRTNPGLVTQAVGTVRHEASLSRGSRVIHLFAVLAVGVNRTESAWPREWEAFVAVAVPRLDIPPPPTLMLDHTDPPAGIRVRVGGVRAGDRVEIRRLSVSTAPIDFDGMGPPLVTLYAPAGNEVLHLDNPIAAGWTSHWYGAAVWRPDRRDEGVLGGRSEAAALKCIDTYPSEPPTVEDLRVDEPGSTPLESLVSWSTTAPLTAVPRGCHRLIIEVLDAQGKAMYRGDHACTEVRRVINPAQLQPPAEGTERGVAAVGEGNVARLYAWVPRPDGLGARLTVKVIDPFGRIGRAATDVPGP